jgi:hypothetical protein
MAGLELVIPGFLESFLGAHNASYFPLWNKYCKGRDSGLEAATDVAHP